MTIQEEIELESLKLSQAVIVMELYLYFLCGGMN